MYLKIKKVIAQLEEHAEELKYKQVTSGFDGFIDYSVHAVKSRNSQEEYSRFQTINEIASYLATKAGKSGTIEIVDNFTKIGGNMPIMSLALTKLGVPITCIGTMGCPELDENFAEMKKNNCRIISIGNPGRTIALEFDDGKIMLAKLDVLQKVNWKTIQEYVSLDERRELFKNCDMLALLNWSEMENATEIWEGILTEVYQKGCTERRGDVFFDMADCSKRSSRDIRKILSVIRQFNTYRHAVLGLNENEACVIYQALFPGSCPQDVGIIGKRLYEYLNIDTLIIHPVSCSMAWDQTGCYFVKNLHIRHPKLSTGGGDNFNSGFAIARMLGLDLESSLIAANGVSAFFIKYGYSPEMEELLMFLEQWAIIEKQAEMSAGNQSWI